MSADGRSNRPAAALIEVPDLTLIRCNAEFQALLEEPHRTKPPVGRRLVDFAPVSYATTGQALRRVGRTGTSESGEFVSFDISSGSVVYRWLARRPRLGRVALLVWTGEVANADSAV